MKNNIVMKFGGSSVATIEHMKRISERIISKKLEGFNVVVVVSAMGKTTNNLIDLAKEASKYPDKRELDLLISTGEQVSISLLSMVLNEKKHDTIALTGYQAGIKTKGLHTKNKIANIDITNITKHLNDNKIVVVAGFQGFNEENEITTLGRGGSDTTAVALAAKLSAVCEIYTDVEGIYGVDPNIYKPASKITEISYEEMKEMAFLGAKVMEPRSIEIGQRYQVDIHVRSSLNDKEGTWIKEMSQMEEKSITGISISEKIMMVTVANFINDSKEVADLFIRLASNEVNVDMISQTEIGQSLQLAFSALADDLEAVNEVLDYHKAKNDSIIFEKNMNVVKISVVGLGMRTQTGVAAKIFKLLADNHINFKLVTTSEISISYIVDKKHKNQMVDLIASNFNL